jgi:hypothetical protein
MDGGFRRLGIRDEEKRGRFQWKGFGSEPCRHIV